MNEHLCMYASNSCNSSLQLSASFYLDELDLDGYVSLFETQYNIISVETSMKTQILTQASHLNRAKVVVLVESPFKSSDRTCSKCKKVPPRNPSKGKSKIKCKNAQIL